MVREWLPPSIQPGGSIESPRREMDGNGSVEGNGMVSRPNPDDELSEGDTLELWLRVVPLPDEYGRPIPPARRLARLMKALGRGYGFEAIEVPSVHRLGS
jgi:hypothetical protein